MCLVKRTRRRTPNDDIPMTDEMTDEGKTDEIRNMLEVYHVAIPVRKPEVPPRALVITTR